MKDYYFTLITLIFFLGLVPVGFAETTTINGITIDQPNSANQLKNTSQTSTGIPPTIAKPVEVIVSVMTKQRQSNISMQQAFDRLKEGNQRFVDGNMKNRNLLSQAKASSIAQFPVAIVLNCMDARTPPEIIFDQGLGDILAVRIAGNVLNDDILGALEFGSRLGAKLIVVLGHTSCGTMRGACEQASLGHLTGLFKKIQPAVREATKQVDTDDCASTALIDRIAKDNVLMVIDQIQNRSPIIKEMVKNNKMAIVGGMQDLTTGKITFLEAERFLPKPVGVPMLNVQQKPTTVEVN